jgi:hypothetical protein
MLVANTIINATQAAMGLTQAAVGLGQAIGQKHDQEGILATQTVAKDYRAGVNDAILNNYVPYEDEILEDGTVKRNFIGYDGYRLADGRTLGDIKNELVKTVGEKYWTKSGAERGTQIAVNALDNIGLDAQSKVAEAIMTDRLNLYNQEMTNAISEYQRTGDPTQINQVIDSATWMTEGQKQAERLKALRTGYYGNVEENALNIAKTQGISAAQGYLDGIDDIAADEKSKILSEAQQAVTQSAGALTAAATERYQQAIQNGSTIGNAYRAATANPGDNAVVNEAVKQAAQSLQRQSLAERFGQELAGSEAMTVQQLENIRRTYENRSSDYQDQGTLYKAHLDQIDNEIARKRAQEAAAANSGNSGNARLEAENFMANIYVDFNNRQMTGPEAIRSIAQIRELSPEKAANYEAKILGGGANPAASQAYLALDAIIRANQPNSRATPQQKADYDIMANDLREAVFQDFYNGATPEDLMVSINGFRAEIASRILQEAYSKGTIGSHGLFGMAEETATAFAYHANQGNLDLRYSERTRDVLRPEETTPLTVGGENAERVMAQATEENKNWADDQLKNKGIRMTGVDYERDSDGDRNGRVRYRGSDGNTYRVNADKENGNRFIERLEDNRWVRVNVRDLPTVNDGRYPVRRNMAGSGTTPQS